MAETSNNGSVYELSGLAGAMPEEIWETIQLITVTGFIPVIWRCLF
jgi:hypothetical protein